MSQFKYTAYDKKGKLVKGVVEASKKEEARKLVENIGLYPFFIEEVKQKKISLFDFAHKVKDEELVLFTHEFASLMSSGLTVVDALQGLAEQSENSYFKRALLDIKTKIEEGSNISDAFKSHPRIFSDIYISLLKVGEATGRLDVVLNGMATYLEKDLDIRRKIANGFAYPKFVVLVVTFVVIFMLTVVLPRFASMFASASAKLPTPTLVLLNISNFIRFKWYVIVGLIALIYMLYKIIYSIPQGRLMIDSIKLRLPLFGRITTLGTLTRFTSTLALIIESGINLLEGVEITSSVTGNAYVMHKLKQVEEHIKNGSNFSEALIQSKFFPKILIQIVSVGEKAGRLSNSLMTITNLWEKTLDYTIKNLLAKIEPTLIIVLGVIVGFIAVAMYLPMFTLPTIIGK
ncbi:MAG: type II secretion system F family protein [Caldisericaceae bacterium]